MWSSSGVVPGFGSAERVSATSSCCGTAGSEAWTWTSLVLCRKDLTGVRSKYTRSSSLSLLASAAGAASSAGSAYRKKSSHSLGCKGPPVSSPTHAAVSQWLLPFQKNPLWGTG